MSTGLAAESARAARDYAQAAEEMRRLREEYEQLKQAMQSGTGSGSVNQQMRDLRTMYAEARQEAERANAIFERTGGAFQALGHAPPSKELLNYIKTLGNEATKAGENIQKRILDPINKGGGGVPGGGGRGGGGQFGGTGLYGFMYMLDDLQYVGQMGLRPIVNNLMMIHPVLGMIGLAADQVVRNWTQLQALWTGESATKTEAERMKELAKNVALTVDEARQLSQYNMERDVGKQLVTQPTAETAEQKKLVEQAYKGINIGGLVETIAEERGTKYTPEQQKELDSLRQAFEDMQQGRVSTTLAGVRMSAVAAGYLQKPTVSGIMGAAGTAAGAVGAMIGMPALGMMGAMGMDMGPESVINTQRYIRKRVGEIQHEARQTTEKGIAEEFAGAETDPVKLRKLHAELVRQGAGETPLAKRLGAIAEDTALTPNEVTVGLEEFTHQQQRYVQTSENSTQKITRLRESAEEYKSKIDQIADSMNKGIIDQETGIQVQLKLATAMRTANEQADDLVTAHDRLVKKMNEEDMAVLAETQAREKRVQQEKSFDVAAKAYAGTMGGSLAQAMMVARARGEDPEAVDIRLRGQLERRMQAMPEGIRGEVSRRVIEQVREQALGMVAQQGAVRDAQRAAMQAQLAPAGTEIGIAQRQMMAQQEAMSGVTPEGRMRLMGPGTVVGAMQRQALAAQKPALQDQVAGNDLAKRMEAAAGRMEDAAEKMASGDIKVKF